MGGAMRDFQKQKIRTRCRRTTSLCCGGYATSCTSMYPTLSWSRAGTTTAWRSCSATKAHWG
eukprot:4898386-Pyramimonas_sp.AAC.1